MSTFDQAYISLFTICLIFDFSFSIWHLFQVDSSLLPYLYEFIYVRGHATLYAFGSVVSDQITDKSDVDFIVDFDAIDINNYVDNYFDLKFSLQEILKRPVDLIEEKAIRNPYFKQAVNKQRKLVYGH